MTQIFNTTFEISRRVLLLLSVHKRELDIDIITVLDLITTYSKNYHLGNENLHGDNSLSFSEIAIRRELISKAIKDLAFKNQIDVINTSNGFIYAINENGLKICNSMNSIYSIEYTNEAKRLNEKLSNKTNQEIIKYVNNQSTKRRIRYE